MVDDVGLTQNGVVAGTPEYMAPEQARGEPIDHRADLFSLGSVLYALCTGVPPFRGSSAIDVLLQVSNETPAPIREQNPNVPVWLEALIARLLAKDPAQRFQSAAEVAALLEGYLPSLRAPLTIPAPELPSAPSGRGMGPGANRWRRVVQLFGLAILLLLALLAPWWFFQGNGAGPIEDQAKPRAGLREVFAHDFRGKPIPDSLALFGDLEGQFLKSEPEGLRITLPKTYTHTWGGVGVRTTFPIEGDFEITATVEILHADRPTQGVGVGATLGINKVEPSVEGGSVFRVRKANDMEVVAWDQASEVPNEKTKFVGNSQPCADKVGRMRLKRTGATLLYQWGAGTAGEKFDTIHQTEFGTGPIKVARVIELRIRSGSEVPAAAPAVSPAASPVVADAPPPVRRKGGLALAVLGAVTVGVFGAVVLVLLQRRRSGKQLAVASGEEQATRQPTPAICFPCSACGKSLKVRADLAGKKVKCPRCAQPVGVPESRVD
jgi:hypothetical protein